MINGALPEKTVRQPAIDANSLLWTGVALVLVGGLLWGGLQANDPLAGLVQYDKARHVVGFATLGICASFLTRPTGQVAAMICVAGFALGFELMQGVFTTSREMSGSDFVASCVGALAGFGFGRIAVAALTVVKDAFSRPVR